MCSNFIFRIRILIWISASFFQENMRVILLCIPRLLPEFMDLASPDNDYRQYSIKETQKVIDITRSLKRFSPATEKPLIIANIGVSQWINHRKFRDSKLLRFGQSLLSLDLDGVELIPQTMAPFPWHFVKRYQNLFVTDEIVHWSEEFNLDVFRYFTFSFNV